MLRMLSQATLEFLDEITSASKEAYEQGGTVYKFSTSNFSRFVCYDDRGRALSRSSERRFLPKLEEVDLRALAKLLRSARGFSKFEDPTPADTEFAAELLSLLQSDLLTTAVTFCLIDEDTGMSGTIELMDGVNGDSFALEISWSYD